MWNTHSFSHSLDSQPLSCLFFVCVCAADCVLSTKPSSPHALILTYFPFNLFQRNKKTWRNGKKALSFGGELSFRFGCRCLCFCPFFKSATFSTKQRRERESEKKTHTENRTKKAHNRIVISSNGRIQRGESESYKTQWSVIKLFIFILVSLFTHIHWSLLVFSGSFSSSSFYFNHFPFLFFFFRNIWCVCKCDSIRLYCDAFVLFSHIFS